MSKTDYAAEYLKYLVTIGAAGYSFVKPTKWASKAYHPNYLDNRIGVSVMKSRRMLRKALPTLVEDPHTVDFVFGIPKAGIAPATLLALEIKKPLLIEHDGSYYSVDLNMINEWYEEHLENHRTYVTCAEAIAATVPFGIAFGIIAAERMGLPFLFVRDAPKEHGKMQRVEGKIVLDLWAYLINPIFGNLPVPDEKESTKALDDVKVKTLSVHYPRLDNFIKKVSICGKRIVSVEDVVSTGETCLKQLEDLILIGAAVFPCAVFSYDFPSTISSFAEYGLVLKSLTNFKQLAAEYKKQDMLSETNEIKLAEWYEDPFHWGDNNGFPSEK